MPPIIIQIRQFVHIIYVHKFLHQLTPPPNQQSYGFPLESLLKDLKQNCEHSAKIANKHSKNCEQTELWTNGRFCIISLLITIRDETLPN